MSVRRARREIDAREFNGWTVFIAMEEEERYTRHSLADWQTAGLAWQTAAVRHTIANLFASKPKAFDLKISDFLVKVKVGKADEPLTIDQVEVPVRAPVKTIGPDEGYTPQVSKSIWCKAFGIDPNDPSTWGTPR